MQVLDTREQVLLNLRETPQDDLSWQALADCLEEDGESARAELVRLSLWLRTRRDDGRVLEWEERQRELLAMGVRPCVPVLVNSIGMELALIPAGRFIMGSPREEKGHAVEERPQHEVAITKPFYLGIYPVTQQQYQAVMGNNPSAFSPEGECNVRVEGMDTARFPVESVSWEEAREFCQRLSAREKLPPGHEYRLPSEAEWEYACRGGAASSPPFHVGASLSSTQANFHGNYPYGGADKGPYLGRPSAVGSYPANAFGLYDLHGNVWEWCADWYGEGYYATSPLNDPQGSSGGIARVFRGGGWNNYGWHCRSALRYGLGPGVRYFGLGFRVVFAKR